MSAFEYESLVLYLEPETLNEEKDKKNTNGVRPRTTKEELRYLKGRKDSPKREDGGKTYES